MTILKVDMSQEKIECMQLPQDLIVGGRGMIDYLMTEYGHPTAHPLSKESLFIAAPGILAGTSAPQSGRLSVGGKSPLTGGIKEANAGGIAAHKLARCDIQAVMVTGRTADWKILKVSANETTLESAGDIVGVSNYAACDKLRERYGNKIGIIIIGPAGEMKAANSTVGVTDLEGRPSRHAARGGVGAIMGAKGLKAIVIDDAEGSLRKPQQPDDFKAAVKAAAKAITSNPFLKTLHDMGTPCFVYGDNEQGSMPTHNHRQGSFDHYENLGASKIIEINKERGGVMGHGCMPGCLVRCSFTYNDADKNFSTAALEYETLAMLGSNLGIDDLDVVARMDRKCDELGLDTIETGGTIGLLNDAGLFEFGDTKKAEELLEEIEKRTPLGMILASGATTTAKVFGVDRIPAVKGQCIPAHTARSIKGWGVTYATSPQGADHTAGAVTEDPLSPTGHVERSRDSQISSAALDATGLCMFTFLGKNPEVIVPMINGFYGVDWSVEDYRKMGREMLIQEVKFNRKAGIGPEQDRIPDWMRKEPLPPTNAVYDVSQEDIDKVFDFVGD